MVEPTYAADLSPSAINSALDGQPHGTVVATRVEPIGTGQMADSARVFLTYDRDDAGPATIVAKFPSHDPVSRATARGAQLRDRDELLPRLAPMLPVRAALSARLVPRRHRRACCCSKIWPRLAPAISWPAAPSTRRRSRLPSFQGCTRRAGAIRRWPRTRGSIGPMTTPRSAWWTSTRRCSPASPSAMPPVSTPTCSPSPSGSLCRCRDTKQPCPPRPPSSTVTIASTICCSARPRAVHPSASSTGRRCTTGRAWPISRISSVPACCPAIGAPTKESWCACIATAWPRSASASMATSYGSSTACSPWAA